LLADTGGLFPVTQVVFSPNGETLATVGGVGGARLWDLATHTQIGAPFGIGVDTVAFSLDGKTVATGDLGGTARLWDLAAVTGLQAVP
jgi:WD40 repeat protein